MKIFLDTAKIDEIKEAVSWGIVDGVTTNPTLVAKAGGNFEKTIKTILKLVKGPVSVEATAERAEGMVKEAQKFAKWGKNVVVKIPMTKEGLKAVKILSKKKIKTNVTLIFSPNQALLAAKAGATYVSPFVGRLDDIGQEGMQIVYEILEIFDNYGFETEVIVASIRHPIHVVQAALAGAHVATIPQPVLSKMFSHSLTDKGIKAFMDDWKKVKK